MLTLSSHHHHHHHRLNEESGQGSSPFKNVKGNITNASPADKGPHHHHHHHHHHGPRGLQTPLSQTPKQPAPPPAPVIPPKTKTVIISQAVLDSIRKHPRHHLGDFIYESDLKPSRLVPSVPSQRGFSSNPKPLPWDLINGKLNCTLTVKIPRVYLSDLSREEITSRGFLWGTDIYTDDSDVIAACIHSGWIRGQWVEDFDPTMLDVDADDKRRKTKEVANDAAEMTPEGLITAPPSSGPMAIPADRDLHVNVVILPRLEKYASTTRYGIRSREFGGEHGTRISSHDGLSFMVHDIRWVDGAQPQARLRGKARRERIRKAMQEVNGTFGNVASVDKGREGKQISGNWRGPGSAKDLGAEENETERPTSEGNKENHIAAADDQPATKDKEEAVNSQDVEMDDAIPAETATEAGK